MNEQTKQEIKSLSEVSKTQLTIPNYQRPYKWTEKNTLQLLNDIFSYISLQNKTYRIGNIILHKESDVNNIVDGQQRLTTISLILKVLNENFEGLLLKEKYKHQISKDNIVHNYQVIRNWVNAKFISDKEKSHFKEKMLSKCEFVIFTVFKQDEAFQLFDSQNSRGKSLEPFDLLKAFHLREMKNDTEEDRRKSVENWEASINEGTLKSIFNNHLFRIRKWSKNEAVYDFTKDEIDEFKGISLHQPVRYPYETQMRILDGCIENMQKDKILSNLQTLQTFPFQITMPIINGKRFFEYVDFYIRFKKQLLEHLSDNDNEFYKKYCQYPYSGRTGDTIVRNLFENIVMQFVDRFGYVEDFQHFYEAFYKEVYIIRCNQNKISYKTILGSEAKKICVEIKEATDTSKLKRYHYKKYTVETTKFVKGIEKVVDFIKNN